MAQLNILYSLAIFAACLHLSTSLVQPQVVSRIMLAAWKALGFQCVIIGRLNTSESYGNESNGMKDFWVQKEITGKLARHISTKTVNLDKFKRECNNQMHLILHHNDQVRAALQKLIAQNKNFGHPKWVLFKNDKNTLEEVFEGVDLPFNNQFFVFERVRRHFRLLEMYRVEKGSKLWHQFYGTWSAQGGFKVSPLSFNQRRKNLHGHVLTALVRNNTPVSTLTINHKGKIQLGGFVGMVWQILEKAMNFRTKYIVQEDRIQGQEKPDKNWTGMIGRVLARDADVAVDTFATFTYSGSGVWFSSQLYRTRYRLYIQNTKYNKHVEWDNFTNPFVSQLWLMVLQVILTLSLCLTIIYRIGRCVGSEPNRPRFKYSFGRSLINVFGIFCLQGIDSSPKSVSSRIVVATSCLTAIVILSAYSAALISSLANDGFTFPFDGIADIVKAKTHWLALEANSAMYHYVKLYVSLTPPGSIFHRLLEERFEADPANLVPDMTAGLERICSSPALFFFTDADASRVKKAAPCDILASPYSTMDLAMSFAVQPYSPYLKLIDHNLRRLHDAGILQRAMDVAFPERPLEKWFSVNIQAVSTVFIFLFLAMIVSIIILILEKFSVLIFKRYGHLSFLRVLNLGVNHIIGRVNEAKPPLRARMASCYRRRNTNLKKRLVLVLLSQGKKCK